MRYLTPQEILVIHARIIDATVGTDGLRDLGLLISACERPKTALFGKEQFPDVFSKAATYLESIARHHVFVDGNKRTALVAAARFLETNGFRVMCSNKQLEDLVLTVVTKHPEVETIAQTLRGYTKPA